MKIHHEKENITSDRANIGLLVYPQIMSRMIFCRTLLFKNLIYEFVVHINKFFVSLGACCTFFF
jgi:hypothetical protein